MTTQTSSPPRADAGDLLPGLSRRSVLLGGAAAAGLAGLSPADARAAVGDLVSRGGVFAFGVASGDPTATEVLLWTRITPVPHAVPGSGRGPARDVHWEVAADEEFTEVVQRGRTRTSAERDHTVKVVVGGLTPYTRYWYRFRVRRDVSPVGRTQTSPDEPGTTHALRLAFASCSNYTGGYFTAYRGIARRDDLDLVLHLGDYVYEYGNEPRRPGVPGSGDRYGPDALIGVRDHEPAVEMVSLEDYRVRHALYKADPDAQAAHARHPWVVIFDDHEITNDAYDTGAENHEEQDDPGTPYTGPGQPDGVRPEGDFLERRARAFQAYLEWMPIREPEHWDPQPHQGIQFFRRFSFGDLADLSVVETRQHRSQQVPAVVAGAVNPALADPDRQLPEPEQLAWLTSGIRGSAKAWHLVGNQTVFARVLSTGGPAGAVFNTDQWDGYQADQAAVLAAMDDAPTADAVVLTGDIHSSWAIDLPVDPGAYRTGDDAAGGSSAGVEFVCPSVTSNGFREILGSAAAAQRSTAAFQGRNPWIRYLDGIGHGFVVLDVTPERVQADFHFIRSGGDKGFDVDPRLDPEATTAHETSYVTLRGSRRVSGPVAELGPRSDGPRSASRR
ncbi:alkaline phosphatase [uncultured Pseudokineococcus sp.]|uniref:alkaline phosphatase D family protein n=1 Tax=uncultured Pseudokineococcus sp. TaxID=1642928 RepID=UPI002607108C|nr:alkaline phosphatase D family protein [uncultured Pseudokineococcus sp.]